MEDRLINLFCRHQLLRKGDALTWDETNQVRQKLRSLARLLLVLREKTNKELSFMDFLKPQFYDRFVDSVIEIRKTNRQLAFTLGHYIRKICRLNLAEAIKSGDAQKKSNSQDFLDLFDSSWSETVASATVRMQQKGAIGKIVSLPEVTDLQRLTKFMGDEIELIMNEDKVENHYVRLQKLVLATLILFNKRRPAEVANLTVEDFWRSFDNQEDRKEIIDSLSPEEKAVANR